MEIVFDRDVESERKKVSFFSFVFTYSPLIRSMRETKLKEVRQFGPFYLRRSWNTSRSLAS